VHLLPGTGELLDLRLEPAARVRLRIPAERGFTVVRIRRGERTLCFAHPSEGPVVAVPPGVLELDLVRWTTDGMETLQTRTVVAQLGEETVVEFDAP
jgi:hypothetical protein